MCYPNTTIQLKTFLVWTECSGTKRWLTKYAWLFELIEGVQQPLSTLLRVSCVFNLWRITQNKKPLECEFWYICQLIIFATLTNSKILKMIFSVLTLPKLNIYALNFSMSFNSVTIAKCIVIYWQLWMNKTTLQLLAAVPAA